MSSTIIYKIKRNGEAEEYACIHNAWRGAMAIWRRLEEKYLPIWRPSYVTDTYWYHPEMTDEEVLARCSFRPSRLQPGTPAEVRDQLWELEENTNVSNVDRVCLMTTMDRAMVRKEYLDTVIYAFEHFDDASSLPEQANLLKRLLEDKDCMGVAWNQTTVSSCLWDGKWDDENGKNIPYKIDNEDDIYYIFEDENSRPLLHFEKMEN